MSDIDQKMMLNTERVTIPSVTRNWMKLVGSCDVSQLSLQLSSLSTGTDCRFRNFVGSFAASKIFFNCIVDITHYVYMTDT